MSLFDWFRRRKHRDRILVDYTGVTRHMVDGNVESIAWSDVLEVQVITTDGGLFAEHLFYLLVGPGESRCLVPDGSDGTDLLFAHLLELPGFNWELFFEAIESTSNRRFVCWKRPAA